MDMVIALVSGVSTGCIYGLVALALTCAMYVANVIVFAVGEILMAGAFGYYLAVVVFRLPWVAGLLLALTLGVGLAVLIDRSIVSPLLARKASVVMVIIGTMAAATVIGQGTQLLVGVVSYNVPFIGGMTRVSIGTMAIPPQQLVVIGITGLVAVIFWLLTNKTTFGMAYRATGINPRMASLVGIDTRAMMLLVFVILGCAAGIAGGLVVPFIAAHPLMGFPFVVKGFMSCIIGGIGNPYGGVIAGIALGAIAVVLTVLGLGFLREIFIFALVLVFLMVRPSGLFGQAVRL